ncbi:MAG: SPW repeat domain-containing protein, partial [Streptosporangiaceae bacterium]
MSTPLIHRPEANGAHVPAAPAGMSGPAEYRLPGTMTDIGTQVSAAIVLLTGVWVALSPWFLTLQYTGNNATIVNLISGLAVAGAGAFALVSPRGFTGLQVSAALLGVWLIIAGP